MIGTNTTYDEYTYECEKKGIDIDYIRGNNFIYRYKIESFKKKIDPGTGENNYYYLSAKAYVFYFEQLVLLCKNINKILIPFLILNFIIKALF